MPLSISGHRRMVDTGEIRAWTVARGRTAPWPLPLSRGEGKAGAVGQAWYSASSARLGKAPSSSPKSSTMEHTIFTVLSIRKMSHGLGTPELLHPFYT